MGRTVLYGLKTCDTCRKALKFLREAGHDVAVVDVRAEPLDITTIKRFHAEFGPALLNRSSATWRGLDADIRAADPVGLIAAHPAVMKRPVIDDGTRLHLGWSDAVRMALT